MQKNRLSCKLKEEKRGEIMKRLCNHHAGHQSPRMHGLDLLKIHILEVPLRTINCVVHRISLIPTYQLFRNIASLISPLVGRTAS